MELTEIGHDSVQWLHLAESGKVWVGFCEHGNEYTSFNKKKIPVQQHYY